MSFLINPAAANPDIDQARRFGGTTRLLGQAGLERLRLAHVVVIGVGGVGSWVAEALARSGVGELTLVDEDQVAESNINRQVHALDCTVGAAKVSVMRDRLAQISKAVTHPVEAFVTAANAASLIPADADVIVDAIDQTAAKAAVIALARDRSAAIVVCGAAGARMDPLRLTRGDLALTTGDALLAGVRAKLRRHHGFSREKGRRFGVTAVYSTEPPQGGVPEVAGPFPLACAGYGSMMTVTAAMAMAAAADTIRIIVSQRWHMAQPWGERMDGFRYESPLLPGSKARHNYTKYGGIGPQNNSGGRGPQLAGDAKCVNPMQ